jgi:hypothetical protein
MRGRRRKIEEPALVYMRSIPRRLYHKTSIPTTIHHPPSEMEHSEAAQALNNHNTVQLEALEPVFGSHAACPRCSSKTPHAPTVDEPAEKPEAYEPVELVELTHTQKTEIEAWANTQTINPKTGKKITPGGEVHRKLKLEYETLSTLSDEKKLAKLNEDCAKKRAEVQALNDSARNATRTRAENLLRRACARTSKCNANRHSWAEDIALPIGESGIMCARCSRRATLQYSESHTECAGCTSIALLDSGARWPSNVGSCYCKSLWSVTCSGCRWTRERRYQSFNTKFVEFECDLLELALTVKECVD